VVTLSTLTGISKSSSTLVETVFQDDENINGSTAGDNCMTVNGTPQVNKYGRLYPESSLVTFRGKRYCQAHFDYVWRHTLMDEHVIDTTEEDRGSEW